MTAHESTVIDLSPHIGEDVLMPEAHTANEFASQLLNPSLSPRAFTPKDGALTDRVTSTWHGSDQALEKLGLRSVTEVRQRDLEAVLSGRHIRTGMRILPDGSPFDLIFTAPNSLSFLWTQLNAEQRAHIENAMVESAVLALDHLANDHPMVDGIRPAQSFVAALILHAVGTLSATNGTIPPMLHVHCCLFGVLDYGGTLVTPHEPTLYDEDLLRRLDTQAEAELADRVVRLGWPVTNTNNGGDHSFEIASVPQELLDADFWHNTGCAVAGP
jgi:TrwC relaxase